MDTTITKKFHFHEGDNYTPELLQKIGEFIADHLDVDLVEDCTQERGTVKRDTKIIKTIEYDK